MEGIVLNWLELECITYKLAHTHTYLFCDNTSTVGRTIKLRSGSSLASGLLLWFLGMHIHTAQASHLTPISISGEYNDTEDVVSCEFSKREILRCKKNLTAYFQNHSPLPHEKSWTKLTLPTKRTQRFMPCLLGKQFMIGSLLRSPRIRRNTIRHGNDMPPHGTSTQSSKTMNKSTS